MAITSRSLYAGAMDATVLGAIAGLASGALAGGVTAWATLRAQKSSSQSVLAERRRSELRELYAQADELMSAANDLRSYGTKTVSSNETADGSVPVPADASLRYRDALLAVDRCSWSVEEAIGVQAREFTDKLTSEKLAPERMDAGQYHEDAWQAFRKLII